MERLQAERKDLVKQLDTIQKEKGNVAIRLQQQQEQDELEESTHQLNEQVAEYQIRLNQVQLATLQGRLAKLTEEAEADITAMKLEWQG